MSGSPATALLADLRGRQALILARGDHLQVRAPRGVVSDSDREALQGLKPALLKHLRLENRKRSSNGVLPVDSLMG